MPTIKIHYFSDDLPRLQKTDKGDWIDLYAAQTMQLRAGDFALIPLGVSMQLPEGYEARTAPRSSTFRRWGIRAVCYRQSAPHNIRSALGEVTI